MTFTLLIVVLCLIGHTVGERLPFIIGGNDVTNTEKWPWQGSMQFISGFHTCGCSLLSTTWAVTAAHCIGTGSRYVVKFGSTNKIIGGVVRDILQIIKHERYGTGPGAFPNDIAVMRFEAVTLSETIKTIQMATAEQAGNEDCWITGWGYTESAGPDREAPIILQEAKIKVYTETECKAEWGFLIYAGHVCVGDTAGTKGACNGDSGGPVVCKVDGSYELVGLASWVSSGCESDVPSVYTRLSYFRDWVKEKTGA